MRHAPLLLLALACACGGGGSPSPTAPAPGAPAPPERALSGGTPFGACGGAGGTLFAGAEVEPHLAADPRDAGHLVAAWQQDRWSNGSARALMAAASFDGGGTWSVHALPFSACAGEGAGRGAEYLRTSDPWLAFGGDGTVFASAISTAGGSFTPGSRNAVLVSRSADGGRTWSDPATLIRDGAAFFNDKETVTADPLDARFVYAAWDRLAPDGTGASYLARSTDGGATWEAPRVIDDPGPGAQTIANLVRVLPDGTLACMLVRLVGSEDRVTDAAIEVVRSGDRGATWSAPIRVAAMQPLGARDPVTGRAIRDGSILAQMAVAPDGALAVVWQDGRFTGARDAIALARSTDGGRTWSAPVRVNPDASTTAFTPQVHVRSDGTLGVGYYVLPAGRPEGLAIPADFRLAQSSDGTHWTESTVSAAFDLALAPETTEGLFLGDYTGLASAGADFLPLYARTVSAANRTDIFFARVSGAAKRAAAAAAQAMPVIGRDADFARRVAENLARARKGRLPPDAIMGR
jgi:hypothetical protein